MVVVVVEVPRGGAVLKASPPPPPPSLSCFAGSRDYGSRDEPGETMSADARGEGRG